MSLARKPHDGAWFPALYPHVKRREISGKKIPAAQGYKKFSALFAAISA
jgi:hypothetical protein